MHSAAYNLQKRAFVEALKAHRTGGNDISFNGVRRKCLTGAVERRRHQDVVAAIGTASTSVEMLAEDFKSLGRLVANVSIVTIDGSDFAISSISGGADDPCVRFIASGDH